MTASPALERVLRGDLCAGCGACAALAPGRVVMETSAAGFARPAQKAPLDAAGEEAIAAVCPGLGMAQDASGRRDDPLWGPMIAVRVGWAADPALRRVASSGGALSAALAHLLETGAVERVIQTAASTARPIANMTVESRSAAEVLAAAGSRYAPSAPLETLAGALARPGRAAFVGKPCDVAALRAMARRDPRIDAAIPYMLSFFCAGVPGLDGARRVLAALGMSEDEVAAFRYRGEGWPGYATATRPDGTAARMSYAESWGGILNHHVQFRCKICPDGVGGFADLVCADAWECDARGYPTFTEGDGRSLIVARTAKGEALARAAMAAGALIAEPLAPEDIAAMQPGQRFRKRMLLSRLAAMALLGRPRPRYRGFHLIAAARQAGLVANLRGFLGTCRRLLRPAAPRQPGPGGE